MLYPDRVLKALQAKRNHFSEAEACQRESLQFLMQDLTALSSLDLADVQAHLSHIPWPGARPTEEHQRHKQAVIPFELSWTNHRQARQWALEVLSDVPTFAVDGSQIAPNRDTSIPVALAQAGWFENAHRSGASYTKGVEVKVLTSTDLAGEMYEEDGFPHWYVNWQRFELEIDCLARYMQTSRDTELKPLCLFDGSLVVSFVQRMYADHQSLYVDAMRRMLDTSEQTKVPVLGYIDTSHANDLVVMLSHLFGRQYPGRASDAVLLQSRMKWGDRTQVYVCAREDNVPNRYYEQVCFVYLKTTSAGPPARVEFPRWIYEMGQHEPLLDLIRAECIVGMGYPYALETADALAVLTIQDRERFYRIFQDFVEREGLLFRFARKLWSKRQRRK